MIRYSIQPVRVLSSIEGSIDSFISAEEKNLDAKTVKSFGEEWATFSKFSDQEIQKIGTDYFDLLTIDTTNFIALDVGCGSGRWARYLAPRVKFIEAIDPSSAVFSAKKLVKSFSNVRVTQASVDNLPFPDNTFDLVYSLGVLHHIPDTQDAIHKCFSKVKSGGHFLLYLYYNLENRGELFKFIFECSNVLRRVISAMSPIPKKIICNIIASIVYWPLAKISLFLDLFSPSLAKRVPLSYYRKMSFFIMRNDALDRFGTPLEKRFSKKEITSMLEKAGFVNFHFSSHEPYWNVLSQKP